MMLLLLTYMMLLLLLRLLDDVTRRATSHYAAAMFFADAMPCRRCRMLIDLMPLLLMLMTPLLIASPLTPLPPRCRAMICRCR